MSAPSPESSSGTSISDPASSSKGTPEVRYNADGLVPVIAQDAESKQVLMLAWMNEAALSLTLTTGWATYFSRSRDKLWVKGETSGNRQRVLSVAADCDGDTLLLTVDQSGPACHTGTETCFTDRSLPFGGGFA